MREIEAGIYQVALNKTMYQLEREGFRVEPDYSFENVPFKVDLFAQNEHEKRIYEFKFGRNRIQRNQFARLQLLARSIGAKLYVIYLEIPQTKTIEFCGIEEIICNNLKQNTPKELYEISTNLLIREIRNVDISTINVDDELVELEGNASLVVEIWVDSKNAYPDQNSLVEAVEFEFVFRLKLNVARQTIVRQYYKFDTGWFFQ